MNQTFHFSRFALLFKKYSVENYKTHLIALGVLAGLLIICLAFVAFVSNGYIGLTTQFVLFLFFFLLGGPVFTSLIFADLGDQKKSIPALTLPVSNFEKYLVGWIYTFIIFQVVYLLCFYGADLLVLKLNEVERQPKNAVVNVFSTRPKFYIAFYIFAVLHAISFIGAIFFERLHFIKTMFTVFIGLLLLIFLNKAMLNGLFSVKIWKGVPLNPLQISEGGMNYEVEPLPSINLTVLLLTLALVFVLWVGTYFRLKEKEV